MGGDVVNARVGPSGAMVEEIGRASDPAGELRQDPALAPPKAAHRIPIAVVPSPPSGWKVAELIAAGAEIPWLGNELDAAQLGRLADGGKKGMILIEAL